MLIRTITGRPEHWGGLFVSSFNQIEVVSAPEVRAGRGGRREIEPPPPSKGE
jgi:hypothetical protein